MSDLIDVWVQPLQRGRRAILLASVATVFAGVVLPPSARAQARVDLPDFTELVERVGPSVVNIRTLERSGRNAAEPDYLPALQRELVAVISKYVKINPDDLKVSLERQDNLEVLEVKIELPEAAR